MKNNVWSKGFIVSILFLALGSWLMVPGSVYAAPERIVIKKQETISKEKTAKKNLKNVKLSKIQDPVAKKAIGEILRFLNLQAGR